MTDLATTVLADAISSYTRNAIIVPAVLFISLLCFGSKIKAAIQFHIPLNAFHQHPRCFLLNFGRQGMGNPFIFNTHGISGQVIIKPFRNEHEVCGTIQKKYITASGNMVKV